MKLACEYELHILPNTKVSAAKGPGEKYMKVRPPLVRHLLRNRLLEVVSHEIDEALRIRVQHRLVRPPVEFLFESGHVVDSPKAVVITRREHLPWTSKTPLP